jgi:hypothetical protein
MLVAVASKQIHREGAAGAGVPGALAAAMRRALTAARASRPSRIMAAFSRTTLLRRRALRLRVCVNLIFFVNRLRASSVTRVARNAPNIASRRCNRVDRRSTRSTFEQLLDVVGVEGGAGSVERRRILAAIFMTTVPVTLIAGVRSAFL